MLFRSSVEHVRSMSWERRSREVRGRQTSYPPSPSPAPPLPVQQGGRQHGHWLVAVRAMETSGFLAGWAQLGAGATGGGLAGRGGISQLPESPTTQPRTASGSGEGAGDLGPLAGRMGTRAQKKCIETMGAGGPLLPGQQSQFCLQGLGGLAAEMLDGPSW